MVVTKSAIFKTKQQNIRYIFCQCAMSICKCKKYKMIIDLEKLFLTFKGKAHNTGIG